MATAPVGDAGQSWSTGIFGCFEDFGSCLMGYAFPCVLYGYNTEKVTGQEGCAGACCAYYCLASLGCPCFVAGPTRKQLRAKHQLKEAPCGDCCTTWCCGPCAVCQEARELEFQAKNRLPAGAYGANNGMHAPPSQQMAAPQTWEPAANKVV